MKANMSVELGRRRKTMIRYRVYFIDAEHEELKKVVSEGKSKATAICKANVLLASDEGKARSSETAIG